MELLWITCGAVIVAFLVRVGIGGRVPESARQSWDVGVAQALGAQEVQQDSFGLSEKGDALLLVLADGKGSRLADGRQLSALAVEPFVRLFDARSGANAHYFMDQAVRIANRQIAQRLNGSIGGASVVVGLIENGRLRWGSCGDCGIGVFRKCELILLNEGDTFRALAQRKYRQGEIGRETALAAQRWGNVLRRLGMEETIVLEHDERAVQLRSGDQIVLLTKGMLHGLHWTELEKHLGEPGSAQSRADALCAALEQSPLKHENASVVLTYIP